MLDLDATALSALVRDGEAHPRELAEAAIAAIEARNPTINAVVHPRFERALDEIDEGLPDGPFRGVPFLLKDYGAELRGEPHHQGMAHLRRLGFLGEADGSLTVAFRAVGLVILGRTNVPEMALMGTTEPIAAGPTRNPWDVGRSPGGSSGGWPLPSAWGWCPPRTPTTSPGPSASPPRPWLVGLKPSRGRVRTGPDADPPVGLFVEGVVTRSVRDTAGLLDAIIAPTSGVYRAPPALPGPLVDEVGRPAGPLRIAVCTSAPNGAEVDPGCADSASAVEHCWPSSVTTWTRPHRPGSFDPAVFEGARSVRPSPLRRWSTCGRRGQAR